MWLDVELFERFLSFYDENMYATATALSEVVSVWVQRINEQDGEVQNHGKRKQSPEQRIINLREAEA